MTNERLLPVPVDPHHDIRLFLGSDNALVRELIELRVAETPGFVLVGSTALGPPVLDLIGRLRPDVSVLTPKLGIMDAGDMELIHSICLSCPDCRLITLSARYLAAQVTLLSQSGIAGLLLEGQGWESLSHAIRSVHDGEFLISPSIARSVFGINHIKPTELTQAEAELMRLISRGLSNGEIATMLNIADSTVRSRLSNVLLKLNAVNRTQAVTEAIRRGYIPLTPAIRP